MPASLSPTALGMLDSISPELAVSPSVQAVMRAEGQEFERLMAIAQQIRDTAFPTKADDTYMALSIWEATLKLPVNPPGVPVAQRQATVLGRFRQRKVAAGMDWRNAMSGLLGTSGWSYIESAATYTVTLYVSVLAGSYSVLQISSLARAITPAHIDIIVVTGQGFVLDQSLLDVDIF